MQEPVSSNKALVIFFSDIVGSTSLYERLGDQRAQQLVSECLDAMISVVTESKGTLIKTVGDEIMASFLSADAAFHAAREIQHLQNNQLIKVKIGFHYGEVIEKNGDYFGNTVNIAARIASRAKTNEILTTEQTVKQLTNDHKNNIRFLSQSKLKGKEELLAIYEVLWELEDKSDMTMTVQTSAAMLKAQQVRLEIKYLEQSFFINKERATLFIGRNSDNDLVINHELASRKHAKIEWNHSRFILTDSSSNGTFVEFDVNPPILIVRDTIELLGKGKIKLGTYTKNDSSNTIMFNRTHLF